MGNSYSHGTGLKTKIAPFLEFIGSKTPEFKILFYGLDAAGKTTILYRLKLNTQINTIPTIGFNVETIDIHNIKLVCWDVGLRDKGRPLIVHYIPGTNAVMFVIDSNDRERVSVVKEELDRITQYDYNDLSDRALLVVANKQDLPNAMSINEIKEKLELDKIKRFKSIAVIGTVATTGEGLDECIDWLHATLTLKEIKKPIIETKNDINKLTETLKKSSYLTLITHKFWSLLGYDMKSSNDQIV